jgi:putative PIN family toxin of toxin-antitoxin system
VKVTLDTNVLFQALYSSAGASHEILKLIRTGEIQIAISVPVFEEYRDVLCRPSTIQKTGLSSEELETVLEFFALVGFATPIDYLWRPNLRDEADNMFVELALASGSEYLITQNVRDYTVDNELLFESFTVTTPSDFLREWRGKHLWKIRKKIS